jgi:O-acetyl-ADP-ribose deacetylase (regulator of RNase III)
MKKLNYIKGDATNPLSKGVKIIAHIVNDEGKWGKGFVMAVSKKWPNVRRWYLDWYNEGFNLGDVQFVQATPHIIIANMAGQKGVKTGSKGPPIRYDSVEQCLEKVADKAKELGASVHMPRIGCGLAGGNWNKIENIIQKTLSDIDTYIYNVD